MANANFNLISTIAFESLVQGENWQNIPISSHPLLAKIFLSGQANKGFSIQTGPMGGTKAIVPLITSKGSAQGMSRADQYTGLSLVQTPDSAATAAEYTFSLYAGNFPIDVWQKDILEKQMRAPGMNFMDLELIRLKTKFYSLIHGHVAGSAQVAENAALGLYFVLPDDPSSSSNNVGQVGAYSGLTGDLTNWRPRTRSTAATLSMQYIFQGINESSLDTVPDLEGERQADLVIFPEALSGSVRLYSRLLNTLQGQQRFVRDEDMAKVKAWKQNIVINGATCVRYLDPPSGEADALLFLDSSSWFYGGDERPRPLEPVRAIGKPVTEHLYVWKLVYGPKWPGRNVKYYGFTG